MLQENSPNSPVLLYCEYCNYKCNKKSDMTKHLSTQKHKCNKNGNTCNIKLAKNEYRCAICNKIYKSRVGLWRHNKSCNQNENIIINQNNNEMINQNTNSDDPNMKTLILDIIKNNTDALKEIMDVCKNINNQPNTINNTNNTDNTMVNSNNKTFNLQVFLNEQCKDAMNLSDFMESIQLNLTDLENMEKLGYTECMFKNIFGHMDFIDIFTRPLHCSDLKRGIIYIKENGIWEKEDAGHSKLINAIRIVEKKNFNLLKEWSKKYPSFSDSNSPYNDKYVKIFGETMNGDKDNLNKVIRKLAKSCVIDKSSL